MSVRINDKPIRINLANYEQRLRKMLTVFRLMTAELEEALEQIEKDNREG